MTDHQPDIDIEAERMEAWWEKLGQYTEPWTPKGGAMSAWKERARLAAEREREMQTELDRLKKVHAEIVSELYGQGFDVLGFHLNGDIEPLDKWFENNGWLEPDNTQEATQ